MMMTYGDGSRDPKALNASCKGFPPMVTLDITAHEMVRSGGLANQHTAA